MGGGVCSWVIEPRCSSKDLSGIIQAWVPLLRIFLGNKAEEGLEFSCLMHTLEDLWPGLMMLLQIVSQHAAECLGCMQCLSIRSNKALKQSGVWRFKWNWLPQACAFECLVACWQNCLGRIMRQGLVAGGVTLGLDVEVSFLPAPFVCGSDGSSQQLL